MLRMFYSVSGRCPEQGPRDEDRLVSGSSQVADFLHIPSPLLAGSRGCLQAEAGPVGGAESEIHGTGHPHGRQRTSLSN